MEVNFYSMNLLMIGKIYLRMKNYLVVKSFLVKVRDYFVVIFDDKKVCMWICIYVYVFCICYI